MGTGDIERLIDTSIFDTIMFFDTHSMIGMLFWVNLFLAAMFFAFAAATKITQHREVIIRAVLTRIGFSIAFLLQLLRGIAPDFVSVNIGISLLFCCFYSDADLMLTFLVEKSEKHYKTILGSILAIGLVAFNVSAIFFAHEVLGSLISSLVILAIYGVPTVTSIAKRRSSRFMRITGGFYVLFLISILQRIIIPFTEIGTDAHGTAISVSGFYLVMVVIGVCGVMATFLFIKESDDNELRAALQAAEDANNAKTAFLANMSHEIRTPMNAIIGMSELLQTESLNERQARYADDIKTSSKALLDIVNEILDISKVEAGKLDLSPVHYDFRAMLNNIDSIFQYAAQNKGIAFETRIESDVPEYLYGDDVRLRQILVNICGNAVKFTERGHVSLHVYTGDDTIAFKIEDTGIGIPKEALSKIFDPFAQAIDSKNRTTTGTGLGLSISRHLAEMMGGSIEAVSVYGQGSIFTVTVPKVEGDRGKVAAGESSVASFHAPQCKVLVVDDNAINLNVALGYLELFDIRTVTSTSGADGIELVKQYDFDIVFMDYMMPDMDGIEATKKIRGMGGKFSRLNIIALTANAVAGSEQMFLDNGFNGFLSKPIEFDKLAEVLLKWLPKEKIVEGSKLPAGETSAEAGTAADAPSGTAAETQLARAGEIGIINTKAGLSNFLNIPERYIETLEMFYNSIVPECTKMADFLAGDNLHGFAVSIHGMKSSLFTIGISTLSSVALELETAAKAEDKQYCESNYPGFHERMTQLHEQLAVVFSGHGGDGVAGSGASKSPGSPMPIDMQLLSEKLQEAMTAADDLDNDIGIEALTPLLDYDYSPIVERQLKSAIESMKNFDFEGAKEALGRVELLIIL